MITRVYSVCGRPSSKTLPRYVVLQELQSVIQLYAVKLLNTEDNWLLDVTPGFTPAGREIEVSSAGQGPVPIHVDIQPVTTSNPDRWIDCRMVNRADLNLSER